MKRPLVLRLREVRALVDPDGSLRSFDSLLEGRALFGFEGLWFYKVQAGVVVQALRPDWTVRAAPRAAQFSGKVFDSVEATQSITFFHGASAGYVRRLRLRNSGPSSIKLRVIGLADPTASQLGESSEGWGSLGFNAFNRDSHVAMDEVSDPPSARVVGTTPAPARFFMTTNRSRAQDFISAGELPESTAGMSGQVLILSLHDLDLAPAESKELAFAFIYNPARLEDALSDFRRLQAGESNPGKRGPSFYCSSQSISESFAWAVSALQGAGLRGYLLDRYECVRGMSYVDAVGAASALEGSRKLARKDGSMPHSSEPSMQGVLETSVLLQAASVHLLLAQDKKKSRSLYPFLKRLAGALFAASKGYSISTEPSLPQGWRRHLGRGHPTGEVPEVTLAAAGALTWASQVARQISKSDDAGKFRERAEMLADRVKKSLTDDRGFLSLCLDSSGRLRTDETIDMAIASYRHQFLPSAEQAAAHRLMEKDFETPYGPRTVPTSNQVYFNRSYGSGQLGGYWTRAALAHASLCYRIGLSGIGSLELQKVSRLVTEDAPKLGGSPGEFPYWVDIEGGEVREADSDPVAAARFIEALIEGELGLVPTAEKVAFSPPGASSLKWALASDIWAGELATVFVGRGVGEAHAFLSGSKVECRKGTKFAKAELLDLPSRGLHGVSFSSPGQILCIGNATNQQARSTVTFSPRGAELSKHLSVPLETLDPAKATWAKVASLRVLPTMSFEASLGPNEWKAFRISTA
ncbi:MAG: hypothetical protein HY297_05725 [Thaumarchaeota archaeon]|nr:hypothetical protein [Nitrososphaerota archaeon]